MKRVIFCMLIFCFTSLILHPVSAQVKNNELSKLNIISGRSVYNTQLDLTGDGYFHRSDTNGYQCWFKPGDISDVQTRFDGFYNVLILTKKDKIRVLWDNEESKDSLTVMSFSSYNDAGEVKKILTEIMTRNKIDK